MADATATACPLCFEPDTQHVLRWSAQRDIYRCGACEALFTRPLPSELELRDFYQGFLYKKPRPEQIRQRLDERKRELDELLRRKGRASAGLTFLDLGGGTGFAYAAAKELGFDAYFGELDEQAIAFVQSTFGLPEQRLVRDLSRHPGTFDYIFSDNVIEHVPQPREWLAQLWSHLSPGGTALIKTPHAAANEMYFYPRIAYRYAKQAARYNGWPRSLEMLLSRPVWACDPPRHLYSFSAASLVRLAEGIGLTAEQREIDYYWTPLLENTFVRRALEPRKSLLGQLRRLSMAPVLPLELASKACQLLARRQGWLEPGGLILRMQRPVAEAG